MSFHDLVQASRYELKYVIDEPRARAVRDFALAYLVPDPYAMGRPNNEYHIHSLYLDSPDYTLCRSTMTGEKNRVKLRIRFYDENPQNPCFCEIKRRLDNVICKQRAPVKRSAIARLLGGYMPGISDVYGDNPEKFGALQTFCGLTRSYQADGKAFVSYAREAYMNPDDTSIRVTFDRRLIGSPYEGKLQLPDERNWVWPRVSGVILEIKFTNRFPLWLQTMVRSFNLDRGSFAKYVTCVVAMRQPGRPLKDPLVHGSMEAWL